MDRFISRTITDSGIADYCPGPTSAKLQSVPPGQGRDPITKESRRRTEHAVYRKRSMSNERSAMLLWAATGQRKLNTKRVTERRKRALPTAWTVFSGLWAQLGSVVDCKGTERRQNKGLASQGLHQSVRSEVY